MQMRHIAAAIGLGLLATISLAEHSRVASSASLMHSPFRLLSDGTKATLRSAPLLPPAPLSTSGFDTGYGISASRLLQPLAYRLATSSDALHAPGVQIQRALPLGFDVGASFGALPGSEASMIGAEARYALIPDSMVLPTIGLRASYGTLQGSDWLNVNTRGIDLSLSKGFSLVTPYAGFGSVWVDSDAYEGAGLAREHFQHDKYFIGATFNVRLMNFAVEADRTGDTTNYHAKFGWRW